MILLVTAEQYFNARATGIIPFNDSPNQIFEDESECEEFLTKSQNLKLLYLAKLEQKFEDDIILLGNVKEFRVVIRDEKARKKLNELCKFS